VANEKYRQNAFGRGGFGSFSLFPPVVKFLLISNVGIYLFELVFGSLTINGVPLAAYISHYGALWPWQMPEFHIYQLVTYMFLHEGLAHVGLNMLVLWMFGVEVENIWGAKKFLIFYTLCGLGGAALHLIASPLLGGGLHPLIGASGAIFGVMVAYGLMYPDRLIYIYFLIPLRAKYLIPILLAIELYMGIQGGDNIGHLAHLGGAIVGMIYMVIDAGGPTLLRRLRTTPQTSNPWQNAGMPRGPRGGGIFRRPQIREEEPVEAEYQDLGRSAFGPQQAKQSPSKPDQTGPRVITQEVIDKILDKIAATGYQNLSQEEREILFEASRKMEEKR
jgi:membrane associated rhomboid family serine protease